MSNRVFQNFRFREAAPRMLADIILVQLAALAALAGVLLLRLQDAPAMAAATLVGILGGVYLRGFLPFTPLFPLVFLYAGLYTRTRLYDKRFKWRAVCQASTIAGLLFLFANFVFTRGETLPRSAAVLFVLLSAAATIGARRFKNWLTALDPTASQRRAEEARFASRVLVVGGAGYIGSMLIRKLLAGGRQVRVLDSLVYGDGAIRDVLDHPCLELRVGDCRNIQDVVGAMKGVDSVIHLAAIVGDPACEQDRQAALEINYSATRMMVEIAKGHGVRRFLFASSCSVYGATDAIVDESSAALPISLYGQTKVDSEVALLAAHDQNFHPVVLRLATVFGNSWRPRFDLVVNLLTAKAFQEGVITIFNGQQWRPFIHVSDVAEGFIKVLDAPAELVGGEIFNLGDSRLNHTLSDIAQKIGVFFPGTEVQSVENADRRNYRVSFDKIRNWIGYEAEKTIDDGILELKQAFESGQIADYTDVSYNNQRFLKVSGQLHPKVELDVHVMAAFARALQREEVREAEPAA